MFAQVVLYLMDSPQSGFLGRHKEVGGIYFVSIEPGNGNSAYRVYFFDAVYLISPKNYAQQIVGISKVNVYGVAFHAKIPPVQINVVTDVKTVYKPAQEHIATVIFSLLHVDDIIIEIGRISHAVDARYGRYHYHILASGKQGGSGGKPELVDFIVYGEVFLYICVRRRKIGFGLIVIIIGYIVFYRVVREKSLELAV